MEDTLNLELQAILNDSENLPDEELRIVNYSEIESALIENSEISVILAKKLISKLFQNQEINTKNIGCIAASAIVLIDRFSNSSKEQIIERITNLYSKMLFEFEINELLDNSKILDFITMNDYALNNPDVLYDFENLKLERKMILDFYTFLNESKHNKKAEIKISCLLRVLKREKEKRSYKIIKYCKQLVYNASQDLCNNDGNYNILQNIILEFEPNSKISCVEPILEEINSVFDSFCEANVTFSEINSELSQSLQLIYNKNGEILKSLVSSYYETKLKDLPNIECILANFALELMNEKNKLEIFKTIQESRRLSNFMPIQYAIDKIIYHEHEKAIFYCELLFDIGNNVEDYLKFLLEYNDYKNNYLKIPREWADSFIERVCSSPFKEVFSVLNNNKTLSPEDIIEVTLNTMRADMPRCISGKFTRYGKIVIKKIESKAVSFAIFINELANYLLKRDCITVYDHINKTSLNLEETQGLKGENYLEMKIFGSVLNLISNEAADYLMESDLPADIESFRERFMQLNIPSSKKVTFLKTSDQIFLGRCGFKTKKFK